MAAASSAKAFDYNNNNNKEIKDVLSGRLISGLSQSSFLLIIYLFALAHQNVSNNNSGCCFDFEKLAQIILLLYRDLYLFYLHLAAHK